MGKLLKGILALACALSASAEERVLPTYRVVPMVSGDAPESTLMQGPPAGERFLKLLHVKRDHVPDRSEPERPEAGSKVWMALRGDFLWVHFRCEEPEMGRLVAKAKEHDAAVYNDDSVEIALDTANSKLGYFHLVVNSIGTVWDAVEYPTVYCDPSWDSGTQVKIGKETAGWTVTLEVPLERLGVRPGMGDLWGANFIRTRKAGAEERSATAPVWYVNWYHGIRRMMEPLTFESFQVGVPNGDLRVTGITRGALTSQDHSRNNRFAATVVNAAGRAHELTASVRLGRKRLARQALRIEPGGIGLVDLSYRVDGGPDREYGFEIRAESPVEALVYSSRSRVSRPRLPHKRVWDGGYDESLVEWRPRRWDIGCYTWPHVLDSPPGARPAYRADFLKHALEHRYEALFKLHAELPISLVVAYDKGPRAHQYNELNRLAPYLRKHGLKAVLTPLFKTAEESAVPRFPGGFYFIHPEAQEGYLRNMREALRKHGDVLWAVMVGDEMVAALHRTARELLWKHGNEFPETAAKIREEVRDTFGFGKWGPPESPQDRNLYRSLALRRWVFAKMDAFERRVVAAAREAKPNLVMIADDCTHGFLPADPGRWRGLFDIVPKQLNNFPGWQGKDGAEVKYLVDLTGCDVYPCPHWEGFAGGLDTYEFASEVFRSGATGLMPYMVTSPRYAGWCYYNAPERWQVISEAARHFGKGLRARLPENAEVALFVSYDSIMASNHQSPFAAAHAVLAYGAGVWYRFVDEGALERCHDLSPYKIIVIPYAPIERKESAEKIVEAARRGAILIVGDPMAFANDRDGSELTALREALLGSISPSKPFFARAGGELVSERRTKGRLRVLRTHEARALEGVAPEEVVLKYGDGRVAAARRSLDEGELFFFGLNALSYDNAYDTAWQSFFRALFRRARIRLDEPIWRLKLPRPQTAITQTDGVCLTGNCVRWERSRPRFFGSFHIGGRYRYSLTPDLVGDEGGSSDWIPFVKGDLCDRHSCHRVLPRFDYRNHRNWIVTWSAPSPFTITVDLTQAWPLKRVSLVLADYVPQIELRTSRNGKDWRAGPRLKEEGKTSDIVEKRLPVEVSARYVELQFGPRPNGAEMTLAEIEVWSE